MSASAKTRKRTPDSDQARANKSAARKAAMTPELKAKIGAAHRGKIVSDETRAKLSALALARMARTSKEAIAERMFIARETRWGRR